MNKISRTSIIINLLFILVFSFMSIGFAVYNQDVTVSSTLNLKGNGSIYIQSVDLIEQYNVESSSSPTINGRDVTFHVVFHGNDPIYRAVYQAIIVNDSFYDYTYTDFNYNSTVTTTIGTGHAIMDVQTAGLSTGDTISAKTTAVLTVTIELDVTDQSSTYVTDISSEVQTEPVVVAQFMGSLQNTTGDLRNNTIVPFTIEVVNTYDFNRTFTVNIANSNFRLVDQNGNNLTNFSIGPNDTQSYTFYVMVNSGAVFVNDTETTSITLNTAGLSPRSAGNITLLVTRSSVPDTTPPTVSHAKLEMQDTDGEAYASWLRVDSGGSSITEYVITLYDANNNSTTYHTNSDATFYTITGLNNGTYYYVVYGIDAAGNSGASSVSSATTSDGYAVRSNTVAMTWRYNVTYGLNNMGYNGQTYAVIHQDFSTTLTANNNYNLPNTITVTMGGQTLTSGTGYTYNANNGRVVVYNVTGDITINAQGVFAGCLIEGTKVLLANGKYKNIENVTYQDLLLVYSHESGQLVEEYPIWIEKGKKTKSYQRTTFSDGSILETFGYHGIFSVDKNLFVSVDNREDFHVGTKVLRIDKNGHKMIVSVKKIEIVHKTVNYYEIISTRYFNIIANNFLVTDGAVIFSNVYGFNKDLTWPEVRENNQDLYTYQELKLLPYYLFKGFRAAEGKYLINNVNHEAYQEFISLVLSDYYLLPISVNQDGKYLFNVSTSFDHQCQLYPDGTYYKLPIIKGVKKYLNTSTNTYYLPGDSVKIELSSYFKAIME